MKINIHRGEVEFIHRPLSTPLHLSSGIVREVTESRVYVHLDVDGHETTGAGSILLSDVWAWRDTALSHEQKDAALRAYTEGVVAEVASIGGRDAVHPLRIGLRLHEAVAAGDPAIPILARDMCASPVDAAIHDAVGRALGVSAFDLYDADLPVPEADSLFPDGGAMAAVRAVIGPPRTELAGWWIVGMSDDLEATLLPAVERYGFQQFKFKLLGETEADVDLAVRVYRALRGLGVESPRLSLDANEANPDADSVTDFLDRLQAADAEAYAAVAYLEQPTDRDIVGHPFSWTDVAARKPVLLDEGLSGFDVLAAAKEQGWSGLALKTCKGHSFALVAAAWARQNGLVVALQDLTNTGYAGVHAALFASRVPTINGVELNSNQFMPDANAEWLPRLNDLFVAREGVHRVPTPLPAGLGGML